MHGNTQPGIQGFNAIDIPGFDDPGIRETAAIDREEGNIHALIQPGQVIDFFFKIRRQAALLVDVVARMIDYNSIGFHQGLLRNRLTGSD